jgi:diguanylate cyclase (GGDEF)-like protein
MDPMRLLIVDDQSDDAELTARQIARGGFPCTWRRVETEQDFRAQLREFQPQLIISDFTLPHYDGLSALALAGDEAPSIPFIFVSGTIGEQRALEALNHGASDYVCKSDLTQLLPAVTRVLTKPCAPSIRDAPSEHIRRIAKALEMLSDMRDAAQATHSRAELLTQACRVIHQARLYDYAFIALVNPHTHTAHAVAWAGSGAEHGYRAQFELASEGASDTSAIGRVLRTGEAVLCLNFSEYTGPLSEIERNVAAPASAFVALPLVIGQKTMGTLTIGTAPRVPISDQELLLLEQLAKQIAYSIQALPDEGTIRHLGIVDPLTGLPKRPFFTEHVDHRVQQETDKTSTTVIVFDVERLREVNAAHGQHAGDRLLQHVAERLRQRFGAGTDLAHFGGGTFAAVFEDRRTRPDIPHASSTASFKQRFTVGHLRFEVTIKCGLARYPTHGCDAETLLQHAEGALQRLRERRDALPYPLIGEEAIDASRRVLEQRVLLATRQQSFSLNYQPVVERVSGQVTAVEALLRWHDAELGLVPPAVFLPVLERTGLIVPVGEWVLTQAAHDFDHWHAIGLPPLRVAINISSVEFNRKGFAADFLQKTRLTVNPAHIDIEISAIDVHHNLKHLRHTLRTLRGEGVRIAIDDFAMTRHALSHLGELPVDSLKIDRSFVNDLTQLPESQAIVSSIIAVARTYGLRTVAEGVESVEQLEILDSLGCEQSQGYLHSPAVSAEQIELIIAGRSQ